jgi:TonB-dependent receptor
MTEDPNMRRFNYSIFIAFILSVLWLVPVGAQEAKGTIAGTVKDSANGVLVGALVEIQPTGKRAVSDDQGQFRIPDVAASEYTLMASYVGFSPFTSTVKVEAGQIANADVAMKVASATDEVIVSAERLQGETEAINIERTADDIVQVLPLKVITSLPNTNVADAVGRLPSVTLERDEGEGKYVQIRGTEPRLTNMMINGIEVPSPEGQVRNIKMDAIPADLVDRIELSKTLSANQDADAIGGTVNLVTKTAGEKATYSLDGQGGYTPIQGGRTLGGFGGSAGKRFGMSKQFGVFLGGSFDRNNRGIDDMEPSQAIQLAEPQTNGKNVAYASGADLRTYAYYRTRYGFDSAVDYNIRPGTNLYVKGFYSDFHDYGDVWLYSPSAGNITSVTGSTITFDPSSSVSYRHYIRRPDQQVFSFVTGARHDLSSMLIHYEFAVSRGHNIGGQDFPTTNFNGPSGTMTLDQSNPYVPRFGSFVNAADLTTNPFVSTLYSLKNSSYTFYHATQLNFQGSASAAKRYTLGSHFGTFELGMLVRNAHKYQIENDHTFTPGTANLFLNQVLGTYTNPTYYSPNTIQVGPFSDYNKIINFVNQNLSNGGLVDDTAGDMTKNAGATWDLTERVYAGYLMNTVSFGKARLQTGVRFEATKANYLANTVTQPATPPQPNCLGPLPCVTPVTGNTDYLNVLPSVQLTYMLTPNTNVRAAFSQGISRPNYQDQVPSQQVDPNTTPQSLQVGNPNLKPERANNYDLLVEHFFQPLGILQGGFFYKSLNSPIYLTSTKLSSGPFAGYLQQQSINGPSAYIYGVEMSWEQRLSFLPSLLNGLGVSANYSYTTSRANFPAFFSPAKGAPEGRIDHPALQRQAPNTWNLGFTYDKARFSMRFGVSHNDANIYAYQYQHTDAATDKDPILGITGPSGDQYLYAHTQVDIQGSYRLYKGLQFVAAGLNLTNEVFGFYSGSPIYPNQREFYKPSLILGMRWSSAVE